MFKKNNFFFGFGLAFLVTMAIFGLLYLINNYVLNAMFGRPILGESTLLIVGLGMNLFFVNYYTKFKADATAKGIVAFTLVCAAYIIYTYFGVDLGLKRE
ncbi:MAG: hypothetical protein EOP53_18965 [Sphingobacteriales bacterium]|nr:MAG: hypothetical protein EOP53_18965 [Sphingobacteriales bacterium]